MRVPVTELARSYYSHTVSAFPPQILPFAVQRFMQGRRLVLTVSEKPKIETCIRIMLWSFRDSTDTGEKSWIPIWYRLPLASDESVGLCQRCYRDFRLGMHELFRPGQTYLERLEAATDVTSRKRSSLAAVAEPLPAALDFLSPANARIFVWLHSGQEVLLGDHSHEYQHLALIQDCEVASDAPCIPLAEVLKQARWKARAEAQMADVVGIVQKILNPPEMLSASNRDSDVRVDIPPPQRDALEPVHRSAPVASAELADRFIRACRRWEKVSREDVEPLDVLFIARCGEPADDYSGSAYARFMLGLRQRDDLRRHLGGRQKVLVERLVSAANLYQAKGQATVGLVHALETLGVTPGCEPSDLGDKPFEDVSRWNPPDESTFAANLIRAFEDRSFPARSVISNRIMGHGCCEEVYRLYETTALAQSIGDYPLDLLLAETALLPERSRECLFYVPLPIPATVAAGTFERFFLSYAVGMASPIQISPEALRETLEWGSATLYSALVNQSRALLGQAATIADRIYTTLRDAPELAPGLFGELSERGRRALVDIVRLGDPHLPSVVATKPFGIQGLERPELLVPANDLTHGAEAQEILQLYRQIVEFALSPHRSRNAIISRSLTNIYHGGLIDDIGDVIGRIGEYRASGQSPLPADLVGVERALRSIQEAYRLFSQRVAWIYDPEKRCLSEQCTEFFVRAIVSNAKRYNERLTGFALSLSASAPSMMAHDQVAIFDDELAVYQIINLLIGNVLKHEIWRPHVQSGQTRSQAWDTFLDCVGGDYADLLRTILKAERPEPEQRDDLSIEAVRWGMSISWCDEDELQRSFAGRLTHAYQRWRPELKRTGGAVVLRTTPLGCSRQDFRNRLDLSGNTGTGLGLTFLKYLTRVYCPAPSPNSAADAWEVASAVDAVEAGGGGIVVLLPGERRVGR